MINYQANPQRYENGMKYARCGRSGVLLPQVSLGFWHNFGGNDSYERSKSIVRYAFDHGVTHMDLANNYGPPYGSAETTMVSRIWTWPTTMGHHTGAQRQPLDI